MSGAEVRPRLLHEALDLAAVRYGRRTVLADRNRGLTFGELAEAGRRAATALAGRGVRRGDRVVVTAADGLDVAAVLYGLSRLGAVFSVLHEQVRGGPLEHVLRDCEPVLLVTDDPAAGATARRSGTRSVLPAELLAENGDAGPLADPGTLEVDPACLIYTSGTTSLPKAVVSTHQQVLFAVSAIQDRLGYRADDVVYCPLPLSFDYGLYQLFLAVHSGARLRLATAAEAGPPLLRGLETSGATVLAGVPSVSDRMAWLLGRGSGGGARLAGLRLLTNTGAALSAETMSALRGALPGLRIQVMYGLTECKRAAIMPPDGDLVRPGSSGLPLAGTEMYVAGDDGERLPAGKIGQFVVRGPHVMAGYWRRPELTAERFHRAEGIFPELRTGDYGWMDEDGYLYFSGRRDDLYKERGFRVSCTEVEAAARRIPEVSAAAVLPPEAGRPALLAVVTELTVDEVLGRMREQIEPFKIPRRCVPLDELPVNGNGKVDRKRLASLAGAGRTAGPGRRTTPLD
ncbi:AMP-binding protein [Streptomyces anulatus]|uniref:class I adenylate-forming enzyme family protein n=1 Tax=Streptomyces anulatus TaxID=1892 RepID=UPI0013BE4F1D|nr:AMP-binding protein [Streptomyces anulatus]NDZ62001.1 AMP-binding protein [Streptomyces anulatus]